MKAVKRHGRFAVWFSFAAVNGISFAASLEFGLFNWWAFGWFLISFAMATHYSSARV